MSDPPDGNKKGTQRTPFSVALARWLYGLPPSSLARRSVGGGLYTATEMEPDEKIFEAFLCWFATNPITASTGYLTITNRRLILNKDRFGIPVFTPRRRSIPLDNIQQLSLESRFNLALSIGSLGKALVVRTLDGRSYTLYPIGLDRAALLSKIDGLRHGR